jgi:hypothetical protein
VTHQHYGGRLLVVQDVGLIVRAVVLEARSGPELARLVSTEHEVLQRVLSGENRVRPPSASQ